MPGPFDLGANTLIAYDTPWGVAGNQDFAGAVGMDFDVINPVIVRQLGCFDDNSDGLVTTIEVRLYNRDTQEIVASLLFDPDDAGTPEREDGRPLGGMRFKPLDPPVQLPTGFHGVIVAEGYNGMERLKNSFANPADVVWATRDGNGSLAFVGTSRFNFPIVPGAFPETPDVLVAHYAGGTFIYETTPPVVPGPPVVRARGENYAVALVWDAITLPLPAARYVILRGGFDRGSIHSDRRDDADFVSRHGSGQRDRAMLHRPGRRSRRPDRSRFEYRLFRRRRRDPAASPTSSRRDFSGIRNSAALSEWSSMLTGL